MTLTWWWLAAAVALLILGGFAWRYVSGLARLRAALARAARGEGAVEDESRLPSGLRSAGRDVRLVVGRLADLGKAADQERVGLKALLATIPEGVFIVDRQMNIRFANQGLAAMFDLTHPPAGRSVMEAFLNADLHRLVQQGVLAGQLHRGEIALPRGKVFELSISPLELGDGQNGAVVVVHNITRIKSLERVRREFVANVSHEFRTPLTIISGYLETLLEGGADDRDLTRNALGVMFKHADRLKHLVDDLLTISRAEARSVPLDLQRLDMRDLLRRVVEQLDSTIRTQEAAVRITAADGDLTLEADAGRIEQVFFNLLDNALKHGHKPGLRVDFYVERAGAQLHVQVSDNGPGIPPEDQEHVFERFYRVHKHRSRDTGGTGLGLSIVKHVVQAHGGSVALRSIPGQGTTFDVTLPLSQPNRIPPVPWSASRKNPQLRAGRGVESGVMKSTALLAALCGLFLLSPAALRAEDDDMPWRGPDAGEKMFKDGRPLKGLPPEEAQRLAAAREKAKNDPTVTALRAAREDLDRQLRNAMRAALLASDPGLAPTLDKVEKSRERARAMRARYQSLTPEEKQQLKSARQTAQQDPAVVAAREKMKSAGSEPGQRRDAARELHQAMKSAMLQADPSIAPLLQKIGPPSED